MNNIEHLEPFGDYRNHARILLSRNTPDVERRVADGVSPAGDMLAGRELETTADLQRQVREGINMEMVHFVCTRYDISRQRISEFMHISASTMQRRLRQGQLTTPESDRFVHLAGLYAMAEDLFGQPDLAARWMTTSNPALGGPTPEQYAETDIGAREVEDLLGRIAHGITA